MKRAGADHPGSSEPQQPVSPALDCGTPRQAPPALNALNARGPQPVSPALDCGKGLSAVHTSRPTQHRWAAKRLVLPGLLLALLACEGFSGCGRKGPPRPPQWVEPRPPRNLWVERSDEGARLRFTIPDAYVDGAPMLDLAWLEILRACPPTAEMEQIGRIAVFDAAALRPRSEYSILDTAVKPDAACAWAVVAISADDDRSQPTVFPSPVPSPSASPAPTTTPSPAASPAG